MKSKGFLGYPIFPLTAPEAEEVAAKCDHLATASEEAVNYSTI
jgi:hypothetical protein